jgi:hypothetical protein
VMRGVNSGDLAAALFTALATRLASGHCSLRPSEDTEVLTERSRILFNLRNKSWTSCHRQISYSNVDSDHGGLAVCGGNFALEFNGERDKPTVRSSRDGGGTDASSALFNTTSELSRGFVGSDLAESRQRNVVSVRLYPNCARGEAAGVRCATPFLEAGKPDPRTLSSSVRTVPITLECSGETIQTGRIGFLGVLLPPRCYVRLCEIPLSTQPWQCPWNIHLVAGLAGVHAILDERQPQLKANLVAPQCDANALCCFGVGSRANRYA